MQKRFEKQPETEIKLKRKYVYSHVFTQMFA